MGTKRCGYIKPKMHLLHLHLNLYNIKWPYFDTTTKVVKTISLAIKAFIGMRW